MKLQRDENCQGNSRIMFQLKQEKSYLDLDIKSAFVLIIRSSW